MISLTPDSPEIKITAKFAYLDGFGFYFDIKIDDKPSIQFLASGLN